jgi:hypothetical protein
MTVQAPEGVFAGFDVLEGFDPIDKAQLAGQPFGITGVRFRVNDSKVMFAEVEIVNAAGEPLAFIDSSTGVRDQLAKYLADVKKVDPLKNLGGWFDVQLYVPRGLRVSSYEVTDDKGHTKQAKTYYLTTQGRQRAVSEAPAKAPAKRS